MAKLSINTSQLKGYIPSLKAGDEILLSGTVYTARDAAHARLINFINENKPLPFNINGATIYYAGPTEAPPGRPIGSCGPTTSGRMDSFSPTLLNLGLLCMIGKGQRSEAVINAIVENGAIYLCAIGGAGALAAKCITSSQVIAFEDLGCESIKRLEFKDFPLIVGIDCNGDSVFK
ncbi:MAG: fumarate hydratase C-terminal domain-containing protein [Clostridia bacterium]|nr:fumarate hydratase C-terminal domain-containing protein [Clostridia bacterium]